jgi:hypothetical protein
VTTGTGTGTDTVGTEARNRRLRILAVIAVVVAIAVIAFLLLSDDDSDDGARPAEVVTVSDLRELADDVGHPIYWAGPRPGERYELTETEGGNVYVRYLPADTEPGAPRPDFLTVGTYPFPNAYATLRRLARRQNAVSRQLPGNGILVSNSRDAQNAYFAYRGEPLQIEVYDPQPGRAFTLARTGQISTVR